ncbi:MAG: hypothetical protein IKX40_14480 [Thermoguttaceae bacterium]|nr:hypothetical protein [Thermoguttaceae bacterium]
MLKFHNAAGIFSPTTKQSAVWLRAYGFIFGLLFFAFGFLCCDAAKAEIAQFSELKPITVQGDVAFTYQQGKREIWIIRNNCQLLQGGRPIAEAAEMSLWLEYDQRPVAGSAGGSYCLTVYMEGQVKAASSLSKGFINQKEDGAQSSDPNDFVWLGEFLLFNRPQITVNIKRSTPGTMPDLYWRAERWRELQEKKELSAATRVNSILSDQKMQAAPVYNPVGQNAASVTDSLGGYDLEAIPDEWGANVSNLPLGSGQRRITVTPRNDSGANTSWKHYPETNQSVACITGGVIVVIDSGDSPESLEISTDKLVIWTTGMHALDLNGRRPYSADQPIEFYMEGNIVFRYGARSAGSRPEEDRIVRAERMFYDLKNNRGTILHTEITTPAEGYDGLLRINADTVHQLNQWEFYAKNAYVTSSQMGKPTYRIQMDDAFIEDMVTEEIDPATGFRKTDAAGVPVSKHQQYINGKNTSIYVSDTPIFRWPSIRTRLERPTPYLSSLRVGSDSVYGFQMFTGWNAYELFNCINPPEGTDLTLHLDPFSNRGVGHGADFKFDRYWDNGLITGPVKGNIDFWGIYDWGKDNLGEGRRSVVPEVRYRYKLFGKFVHEFNNGLQLTGETGLISDRDFMEEYYRDDWYTKPTPKTRIQLRQEIGNFSWDVAVQGKVNGFYTESQEIPRLDAYWLGESLLGDLLTWYSASSAGLYNLSPASYPEAPENQKYFDYLAWEQGNFGGRFTTRHELDLPFQAGAVKLVPYVMGEAGWWGASETASADRFYGQVGVRASLPMWKANPCFNSDLFDVHGLVHKVSFETEWYIGSSSRNMTDLPMYSMLDEQSIIQYRHMFQETVFGGPIPWRFDERSYALRSGLGNHVTSPAAEILDDLHIIRFNVNQRWQTKRRSSVPVDWITLNAGVTLFPNASRDNFGKGIGLLNYDFTWQLGDRFAITSAGLWDFFDDGIHSCSVGGRLIKPGVGELNAGVYWISNPVRNTVLYVNAKYWMSPKWHFSFGSEFDISGQGNIGQNFAITRVGESLIVRTGFYVDATRDDYGVTLTIEPRFIPKGSLSRSMGGVRPYGFYGLE